MTRQSERMKDIIMMGNMMGAEWGGMMGGGWGVGWVLGAFLAVATWLVWLTVGVMLIIWLWRQIGKK